MIDSKTITSDIGLKINLYNVKRAYCELHSVTPRISRKLSIDEIKYFYVKDYFLVTNDQGEEVHHKISRFLYKEGHLKNPTGKYRYINLYRVKNDYKCWQYGEYPKDLYHPIKWGINRPFFRDDYYIENFSVIGVDEILNR
jgi:hypothetical protein